MKSDKKSVTKTAEYKRTPEDEAAVKRFLQGRDSPRMKVTESGDARSVDIDHQDPLVGGAKMAEALGTTDLDYLQGMLGQLNRTASAGKGVDEDALNFALSLVKSFRPRNQIEGMLATQMAVMHLLIMKAAERLASAKTVQEQDFAVRAFIKLTRTFSAQLETFRRLRTNDVQIVVMVGDDPGAGLQEQPPQARGGLLVGSASAARLTHQKETTVLEGNADVPAPKAKP